MRWRGNSHSAAEWSAVITFYKKTKFVTWDEAILPGNGMLTKFTVKIADIRGRVVRNMWTLGPYNCVWSKSAIMA